MSLSDLAFFELLGRIIGVAIRTKSYVGLALAPIFWKQLSGESLDAEDLRLVHATFVRDLDRILSFSSTQEDDFMKDYGDRKFTVRLTGCNDEVDLFEYLRPKLAALGSSTATLVGHGQGAKLTIKNSEFGLGQSFSCRLALILLLPLPRLSLSLSFSLSLSLPLPLSLSLSLSLPLSLAISRRRVHLHQTRNQSPPARITSTDGSCVKRGWRHRSP